MLFAWGPLTSATWNSPFAPLFAFLPFLGIGVSIYYLYKNRERFFIKVDQPTRRIGAPGKQFADTQQKTLNQPDSGMSYRGNQFANATQDHMKQQSDLPRNEPITIDGLSQKGSQKVKPKISFKLAYLLTVIGILATFAYQIDIFLKAEGMDIQDVSDGFNEAMASTGTPITIAILFMVGIFLTSAIFPAIFVFFILNLIFGRSQMIQTMSAQQRTVYNAKIKQRRVRQVNRKQDISGHLVSQSSANENIYNDGDPLFSSTSRSTSSSQEFCKKCYGALNFLGKCGQCD